MIEFSFFCPNCKKKIQGIAIEKESMSLDLNCYDCNTDWEKIIVDRSN
jgi:DNA-directed RNA polymerase subunit RPC12/RpoP